MALDKAAQSLVADISARLKAERIASGRSQGSFATELGLTESRYAKYENRSPVPIWLLPRICALLGLEPWELLTGNPWERQEDGARPRRPLRRGA